MTDIIRTEVLVIGGGGAACRAALEAHRAGAKVLLVTKGNFGAIGTRGSGATAGAQSQWGLFSTPGWTGPTTDVEKPVLSKFFPPPRKALEIIREVGLGMADPKLSQILVDEVIDLRKDLLNMGATFGEWGIRSHGVPMMGAFVSHFRKENIPVRERMMIVDLLVGGGECVGAVGVDEMTGNTVLIQAGATFIGTGGDANLFLLNLNPPENTGDGFAMGYKAGAELMNLEFKQMFIGSVYPTKNSLFWILHPYAKLTNALGENFLQKYLPEGVTPEECLAQRNSHNPFSIYVPLSKYFDIAVIREVEEGRGTKHYGVWLDRSDPRIPPVDEPSAQWFEYRGIDVNKGPLEINVLFQCNLGGFRIDENGQTTLRRLYSAGEAAAGPHGAARIGGYMMPAGQVFGARAGRHAATVSKSATWPNADSQSVKAAEERIRILRESKGDQKPINVKEMIQKEAFFNLLIIRSERRLNKLLTEVKNMRQNLLSRLYVGNPKDLIEALELQNLLELAEIEANICLKRTESRGSHYREDFPEQDDKNWLKSITAKKEGDRLRLDTLVLDPLWESKTKLDDWG